MAQPPPSRPSGGLPPTVPGTTPAKGATSLPQVLDPVSNVYLWNGDNNRPVLQDLSSAKKLVQILPPDKMKILTSTMDSAYGAGKWKYSDLISGWGDAAEMSGTYLATTNDYVSVFDAFQRLAQVRASNGLSMSGKAVSGGAGGTSYTKQTSIRLTDPSTARGLVDTALNNYLGRNATQQEQQQFLKALNYQEKAAPTVTEQITSTSGKSSTIRSTTTGGFDPATFAKEYAAGIEGAGEFQAATSLLDSFIQAIGAKV